MIFRFSGRSPERQSIQTGRRIGRASQRVRALMFAAEVALSLMLLVGAGLFAQTLSNLQSIPLGRFGTCDEVADMVVFLAGRRAGYITGQVFGVNGGLYM